MKEYREQDEFKLPQEYADELSLLAGEDTEDYVLLNLKKVLQHRQKFDIPVIGIAGAEGKSTTKRMLATILEPLGPVLQTPIHCATTTGVTTTLLKLNKSYRFAILELGIVNPVQFELAVQVAQPNIAIVTNIGEAHLATEGDRYLLADAKVELIRNLPPEGFAILNMDDDLVSAMEKFSPTPRVIKFGLNANAHFFASDLRYLGPDGIEFKVNNFYPIHLHVYNSAFIYNALAAIAAARIFGVEFDQIRRQLETFRVPAHRGNLISMNDIHILDYTYDARINSVNRAAESLVQFKPYAERLVMVIGGVSDPGPRISESHLKIGFYLAALPIDVIITVGEHGADILRGIRQINHSHKILKHCERPEDIPAVLKPYLTPGTAALITGSKALQLETVVDSLPQWLNTSTVV